MSIEYSHDGVALWDAPHSLARGVHGAFAGIASMLDLASPVFTNEHGEFSIDPEAMSRFISSPELSSAHPLGRAVYSPIAAIGAVLLERCAGYETQVPSWIDDEALALARQQLRVD